VRVVGQERRDRVERLALEELAARLLDREVIERELRARGREHERDPRRRAAGVDDPRVGAARVAHRLRAPAPGGEHAGPLARERAQARRGVRVRRPLVDDRQPGPAHAAGAS
jgi:hypothetical protein